MGLKDLFGLNSIKQTMKGDTVKLDIQGNYTITSLYNAIKDAGYGEAGYPELVRQLGSDVIAWPAIDSDNQVWVCADPRGDGFVCFHSTTPAGLKNTLWACAEIIAEDHDDPYYEERKRNSCIYDDPYGVCADHMNLIVDRINELEL